MTNQRYKQLQFGDGMLTAQELEQGWHFCSSMDQLLCKQGRADCFCVDRRSDDRCFDTFYRDVRAAGGDAGMA